MDAFKYMSQKVDQIPDGIGSSAACDLICQAIREGYAKYPYRINKPAIYMPIGASASDRICMECRGSGERVEPGDPNAIRTVV